jgi:cyclopropane fatty-acyl-phospholipid synthase-like methyltransferase
LDLGGSHGIHSIECCRKVPGLTAEVFDLEPTRSSAERTIRKNKMSKKVKFRSGDFLKDSLGNGYDVVLAFNVIHGLTESKNQKLAKRVFDSMNPGGIYVILDQIKEARGKSQLSQFIPATMGVMLFNQTGGRTYSFEEVEGWVKKVGFKKIEFKKLRSPGNGLIVGYKS